MKINIKYTILFILFLGVTPLISYAQKTAEEELKEANKLFEEGKYKEAAPLFLKKLSVDQKSGEYNFKYGTCILYSEGDKKQGLRYLKYASQVNGTDTRVFYHLGQAYHLNYMFSDAIKSYNKFVELNPKLKDKYEVQKEIDACNYGKKLLRKITDIQVVSKKEFTELNFFYAYALRDLGGQMAKIDGLKTKLDEKNNHNIIVYFPDKKIQSPTIYYSSYGDDIKSGKDIYKVNRLPDGSFGKPQKIIGPVNTQFDEDFPYMHPDGRTFYFASKGHNSMGGYDIFRCYYDEETGMFSAPENVDFAINTPGDDILYVTDSLDRMAFFASTRESPTGKINVYNVLVERLPVNIAILKGTFVNQINAESLSATITVEDAANGDVVGIYNTNANNGGYLISLPKGGKYKFSVVAESQIVHTGIVEVPPAKELRPLKQELELVSIDNQEKLKIKNLFDENFEDADAIIAEVLAGRAELNPNISPEDTMQTNTAEVKIDSADIIADEDIMAVAKKDADQLQKDYEMAKAKMDGAYNFAAQKQKDAKEKSDKANNLIKEANATTNEDEKEQLYAAAAELNEEAAKDMSMAIAGLNLAKGLEDDVKQKEKDAKIAKEFSDGIEKAVNAKNHDEVIAGLQKQQEFIKSIMGPGVDKKNNEEELRADIGDKQKEIAKIQTRVDDLRSDEEDLVRDIKNLKAELENPNTKKDRKKEIESELASKESELSDVKAQLTAYDKKYKQLTDEQNELESQLAVITGISDGGKELTQAEKDALNNDINKSDVAATIEKNKNEIGTQNENKRNAKENASILLAENENIKNLDEKKNQAKNNPDKKQGLNDQKQINTEYVEELDKNLTELEANYNNETDPEKKKDIAKTIEGVKEIKEEKIKENESIDNDLAQLNNTSTTNTTEVADWNTTQKEEAINELVPNFEKKKSDIDNSNGSEKDKLADKVDLNDQLIKSIDNRIYEIDNSAFTGDDLIKANKEREELEKIKYDLEKENETNEAEIARIEKEATNVVVNETKTSSFNENDKNEIASINPDYNKKIEEINNSDKSDVRKEYETKKANEDLLEEIINEEKKVKSDASLSEEEKSKKLNELDDLKNKTNQEIDNSNKKLNENGVAVTNKTKDYSSNSYTDPNAKKDADAIKNKLESIDERKDKIEELKIEIAEAKDDKEKTAAEKKLATEEKAYNNEVNSNASKVEKINTTEAKATQNNNEEIKNKVKVLGQEDTNNENYIKAKELEETAEKKMNEAAQLRQEAKDEKDPAKKAELNNKANELEQEAIAAYRDVETWLDKYLAEMTIYASKNNSTATNNTNSSTSNNLVSENKDVLATTDNSYTEKINSIESSSMNDTEKDVKTIEANDDLLKNIDKKEMDIRTDFTKSDEEKRKELEELEKLRQAAERDNENRKEKLNENGVHTREKDITYNNIKFDSEASNSEIKKVEKKLNDLEKAKADADAATLKYINQTDEKQKAADKKAMDKKNADVAKKEIEVSDELFRANQNDWNDAEKKYLDKKKLAYENVTMPADDRRKEISAIERDARQLMKEADELRKQAEKEKDVLRKAELLRAAYSKEQDAIEKLKLANNLFDQFIADGLVAKAGTNEKDADGNIIIPEATEDRASSKLIEEANKLKAEADSLFVLSGAFNKKAEKGNKKSREENKKIADDYKEEAEMKQNLADNLYKKASEDREKENLAYEEQVKRNEEKKIAEEKKSLVVDYPEYSEYYNLKKNADEKKNAGDQATNEANKFKEIADNTRKEANDTRESASNEADENRKNELLATADDLDKKADKADKSADSLNKVAERFYVESSSFNWNMDEYLSKIDSKKAEDIRLATSTGTIPQPNVATIAKTDPTDVAYTPPTVVSSDVFTKTEKSVYSEENPIPVDVKKPTGTYLKVQVGAFRNKIPQDLYKDFAPVTGETTPTGLTRYTVGYFTSLPAAIKARDEIRTMGYRDAFIVGFDNGERANFNNVVAKLGDNSSENNNTTNTTNSTNTTNETNTTNSTNTTNTTNSTNSTNTTNTTNTTVTDESLVKDFVVDEKKADYYKAVPNAAKANQVEVVKGLFFTVQIGVYSRPVTPDKLFNLSPLNSELITRNSTIRYTTGVYTSFDKANARKDEIRSVGIRDAFVVAYINGNRIMPEKANELLKTYGDSILVNVDAAGNPIKETNSTNPTNETNLTNPTNETNQTNPTNSTNETHTTNKSVENLEYQVILGEFINEIPGEIAEVFVNNMNRGIKRKDGENNSLIYYIGGKKTYNDALVEKAFFFNEGITDVNIVPLYNGETISLEEAQKIVDQN